MLYFNTERIFLVPSFDLEVKEKEKMTKFLTLLDNSGVGKVIEKYIKTTHQKVAAQDITTIAYLPQ